MGKQGELWDDSALIKAFDSAFTKYKGMHGIGESIEGNGAATDLPDKESNVHVQDDDYKSDAALNTNVQDVGSTNTQSSQNEFSWYSNGQDEYNQLWNKYYEIENQRQKVLQQLTQYSNWNNQNSDSSAFTAAAHQASVPQPHDMATCYCTYGCQNWVIPVACNSFPASCSSGTCTDKDCTLMSKGAQGGTSRSQEDPSIVKMTATEKARSSLMKVDSRAADTSGNGGKDKEFLMETGSLMEKAFDSPTELSEVLNAWFSAGVYTGKYLTEQSLEKKKHG